MNTINPQPGKSERKVHYHDGKLRHKYALSEKGAKDMVRAFIAVTISNLVLMLPVGLLYKLSSYLLECELKKSELPFL